VQLLKRLVDLDEILYGGDDNEGNVDAIFFLISDLQPFQSGEHLNFCGGATFELIGTF
jgi:hypothetical protein